MSNYNQRHSWPWCNALVEGSIGNKIYEAVQESLSEELNHWKIPLDCPSSRFDLYARDCLVNLDRVLKKVEDACGIKGHRAVIEAQLTIQLAAVEAAILHLLHNNLADRKREDDLALNVGITTGKHAGINAGEYKWISYTLGETGEGKVIQLGRYFCAKPVSILYVMRLVGMPDNFVNFEIQGDHEVE